MTSIYRITISILFAWVFSLPAGALAATDYIYWHKKTPIPTSAGTSCITSTPDGSIIIVGTYDKGIFISADSGNTWQQTLSFTSDSAIYCIKHVGGQKIIAGGEGHVYISDNNGTSWRNATISISYPVRDILSVSSRLYVCTGDYISGVPRGDGVLVSSNGGSTWTRVNTGLPLYESVWNLASDRIGRIFVTCMDAGTGHGGLYYTENSGTMWTEMPLSIDGKGAIYDDIELTESFDLAVSPNDTIICSSDAISGSVLTSGIFKNTFGGALANRKWSITGVRPSASFWQRNPTYTIYFMDSNRMLGSYSGGTITGGPYFSADYGNTWQHMTDGVDIIGGGLNANAYTRGLGTRTYMVQYGDDDLYYMDSIVHTPAVAYEVSTGDIISVFPNPTSSVLHITGDNNDPVCRVEIVAVDGVTMPCKAIRTNGQYTIYHHLPSGYYFLKYTTVSGAANSIKFYAGQ